MKKVSEWLKELDGHAIYDYQGLAKNLKDETGSAMRIGDGETIEQVNQSFGHFKGVVEKIRGNGKERVITGYEVATELAKDLASFRSPCIGRGSVFRTCVDAIERAGL